MQILGARPYAGGGSYAERVHLYIAPAFSTSIAAGRGPHRNLGADGKPHRATWRGVMPALARAGGVWIEMYHHSPATGLTSMTAPEWRTVPAAFATYSARFGTAPERLHMMLARRARPGRAPPGAARPWRASGRWPARRRPARRCCRTGPGAYRLGEQATAWRSEYNRALGGT